MSDKPIKVRIENGGELTAIYDDRLRGFLDSPGPLRISRASAVEPAPDGTWTVDLTRSGGPIFVGIKLKQEALDREVEWLNENIISSSESLKGETTNGM